MWIQAVFVLFKKRGYPVDRLYEILTESQRFSAVVDRTFRGRYRNRYDALIEDLPERNIIRIEDGIYHANVER